MNTVSRRRAMTIMAAGGAGAALTNLVGADEVKATTEEQAATAIPIARAFAGKHQPKPLPFDPTRLKGISEKLIKSHWENNYGGAVKALNAVEQRLGAMLGDKDLPPYVYGDLKREELARTGSVVLPNTTSLTSAATVRPAVRSRTCSNSGSEVMSNGKRRSEEHTSELQ